MDNENTFNTKYGAVNVSTAASSNVTTLDLGFDKSVHTVKATINPDGSINPLSVKDCAKTVTADVVEGNTFGLTLKSDGSINPLSVGSGTNTVEIDDDPTNTYGLASKVLLLRKLQEHNSNNDAHTEKFNNLIKTLTDLYEEKGQLKAYKISDDYGNVINANCKVIVKGDETNPKYIMLSSEKMKDFDKVINDLIALISAKQDKINDLATIRNGAELGSTAVQPSAISDMETKTHAMSEIKRYAVPKVRKINSKMLLDDITLNADDVGARPNTWVPDVSSLGMMALSGTNNITDSFKLKRTNGNEIEFPTASGTLALESGISSTISTAIDSHNNSSNTNAHGNKANSYYVVTPDSASLVITYGGSSTPYTGVKSGTDWDFGNSTGFSIKVINFTQGDTTATLKIESDTYTMNKISDNTYQYTNLSGYSFKFTYTPTVTTYDSSKAIASEKDGDGNIITTTYSRIFKGSSRIYCTGCKIGDIIISSDGEKFNKLIYNDKNYVSFTHGSGIYYGIVITIETDKISLLVDNTDIADFVKVG